MDEAPPRGTRHLYRLAGRLTLTGRLCRIFDKDYAQRGFRTWLLYCGAGRGGPAALSEASTFAALSTRSLTTATCPNDEASISAVGPSWQCSGAGEKRTRCCQ